MRAEDSDLSQLEALGAKNWPLGATGSGATVDAACRSETSITGWCLGLAGNFRE